MQPSLAPGWRDSLTLVDLRCGGNAPQTRELQNQECILTLKEAESKDKVWEGLVSDKAHLPVL